MMYITIKPRGFQFTSSATPASGQLRIELSPGTTIRDLMLTADLGIDFEYDVRNHLEQLEANGAIQFQVDGADQGLSYVLQDEDYLVVFPYRPYSGG